MLTEKYNRAKGQLEIKCYETEMNFESYKGEAELAQTQLRQELEEAKRNESFERERAVSYEEEYRQLKAQMETIIRENERISKRFEEIENENQERETKKDLLISELNKKFEVLSKQYFEDLFEKDQLIEALRNDVAMGDERIHLAESNLRNQIVLLENERDELSKLQESEMDKLRKKTVQLTETLETETREEAKQVTSVVARLKQKIQEEKQKNSELEQKIKDLEERYIAATAAMAEQAHRNELELNNLQRDYEVELRSLREKLTTASSETKSDNL